MTKEIDFSKYSSIKIGKKTDVFVIEEIASYDDYFIVGRANNTIVSNTPPPLAVLSKNFDYIERRDGYLYVGAATLSGRVFSFCKREKLGGLEFLLELPGSIGGVVKMNAGLKEWEIFENLVAIKSHSGYIEKADIDYGYRNTSIQDTIFEAVFDLRNSFEEEKMALFRKLRSNQPKGASAGSVFKNPKGDYAGRLIESVGLKGYKIGGAIFSEVHANFLINSGGASFEDAKNLIELAQKRVFESSGIELELEVILL